jgi:hypothetical protein
MPKYQTRKNGDVKSQPNPGPIRRSNRVGRILMPTSRPFIVSSCLFALSLAFVGCGGSGAEGSSIATGSTSGNTGTTSGNTGSTSGNDGTPELMPNQPAIPTPVPLPPPVEIPIAGYPGVFFDDFFSDNLGQPEDAFNGFIQFEVTDGTVDFVGGNVIGAQGGRPFGRFIDLGGSSGNPGRFATRSNITFLPGIEYTLSFAYLSTDGQAQSATVSLGDKTFTVSTSDPRQYSVFSRTFTFDQPTSVPLVFQDGGDGRGGVGVDFIFVRPTLELP